MIRALGRAKVNLCLAVAGRRPDGYHELETVMQSVSLSDELTVVPAEHSEVVLRWADGLQGPVPESPDIVQRTLAAARLQCVERPSITVTKRIPVGAGLGGASADAAAALLALSRLEGPECAHRMDVERLAAQLGADVTFCLHGGVALATGIGDRLEPLPCAATLWWVVGIPARALPTVKVYQRYDALVPAGRRPGDRQAARLAAALADGDLEGVALNLANDLEVAAFDLMPELRGLKQAMASAGALAAILTGSGSAIVGLCRGAEHAREVAAAVAGEFPRVEVVHSTPAGAEVVEP